uniref:Uncharacterized protein n=1 Tax=Rhizophora mucronata TaxID=61149 RepID=A0A2P2PMI1_RHIMU
MNRNLLVNCSYCIQGKAQPSPF